MTDPLRKAKSKIRKLTTPPRIPKPPTLSQILSQAKREIATSFKPSPGHTRSSIRIKWKPGAFRLLRLEAGVQNYINQLAADIAARAGDGYEVSHWQGKNRSRASVYTDTFSARYDNARHQTLLRALDAGQQCEP